MILRFKLECKAVAPKCSDDSLVTRRLASAPQACEVVGRGGQRPLDGHLGQASFPEPPHPALFFQDSVHRSEEHTSELQSQSNLVCRLLLEKKKKIQCENVELRTPV